MHAGEVECILQFSRGMKLWYEEGIKAPET